VTITPVFTIDVEGRRTGRPKKQPPVRAQQATFELTGVELFTRFGMDPGFACLFAGLGLVEESKSIQDARAAFREAHSGHSKQELDNIDAALKRVTRNDPDLLLAYYRFYADTILTNKIDRSSKKAGKTNKSIKERWGNLYTDINAGVLSLAHLDQIPSDEPLLLLGSTLIHEYVHTAHASDLLSGPGEGKAYGFEICTT